MRKVIIDTDIGTDVDDALALLYALKSPELDLKAVTTVHGNTEIRGKIAKRLCQMIRPESIIPVVAGHEKPLKSEMIYWFDFVGEGAGIEGITLEKTDIDKFLSSILNKNEGLDIIAIAPYTNIARLFQAFPDAKNHINRIYLMNRGKEKDGKFLFNKDAHNTKADPDAASIVFNSGVPITLITTELSKQTYLTMKDFEAMLKRGEPWSELVYQNALNWLRNSRYHVSYLYDPLTVAVAENPAIVSTERYGNIEVATGLKIDFKDQFLRRIGGYEK